MKIPKLARRDIRDAIYIESISWEGRKTNQRTREMPRIVQLLKCFGYFSYQFFEIS